MTRNKRIKKTKKTKKKKTAKQAAANEINAALFKEFIANLPEEKSMYSRRRIRRDDVFISVELAYAILEHNTSNRGLRQATVDKYARDMSAGKWTFCSDKIVLSDKGVLLNGQHRLYAIIESGKGQEFTILYGPSRDVQKYIDINPARTLADVLKLDGLVPAYHTFSAAVLNRVMCGTSTSYKKNRTEQIDFLKKHEDAIAWGVKLFKENEKPDVTTSPVVAAIVRASYYVDDLSRLERFVEILKEGIATADEKTAIVFRDWLHRREYRGGASKAAEVFLRTQGAVHYFLSGKRMKKSVLPEEDIFPLPETDPATGIKHGATSHRVSWYRNRFNGDK